MTPVDCGAAECAISVVHALSSFALGDTQEKCYSMRACPERTCLLMSSLLMRDRYLFGTPL